MHTYIHAWVGCFLAYLLPNIFDPVQPFSVLFSISIIRYLHFGSSPHTILGWREEDFFLAFAFAYAYVGYLSYSSVVSVVVRRLEGEGVSE